MSLKQDCLSFVSFLGDCVHDNFSTHHRETPVCVPRFLTGRGWSNRSSAWFEALGVLLPVPEVFECFGDRAFLRQDNELLCEKKSRLSVFFQFYFTFAGLLFSLELALY